jgi:hypothetical protein
MTGLMPRILLNPVNSVYWWRHGGAAVPVWKDTPNRWKAQSDTSPNPLPDRGGEGAAAHCPSGRTRKDPEGQL